MVSNIPARVALLVDGDNISAKHAPRILDVARGAGGIQVARSYADCRSSTDWHSVTGFRLIHAGTGKNAADILLCLDAMELALSGQIDRFVLCSSDGDFSHLALRLRERGLAVIGIGEPKAPKGFREACQTFVALGDPPAASIAPKSAQNVSEIDRHVRAVIAAGSKKGAGIAMAALGAEMNKKHGVQTAKLPEKNWRAYLGARPALYDLDPRGPTACVRFRPEGFLALG